MISRPDQFHHAGAAESGVGRLHRFKCAGGGSGWLTGAGAGGGSAEDRRLGRRRVMIFLEAVAAFGAEGEIQGYGMLAVGAGGFRGRRQVGTGGYSNGF